MCEERPTSARPEEWELGVCVCAAVGGRRKH